MPPVSPAPSRRRGGRIFFGRFVAPGATKRPEIFCALVVAVLLGGCRVDATVETRVEGRSGEVRARLTLDPEAVALLGGNVDQGAQVDDLRRAGWVIPPARRTGSGGAVVRASKRFHRPEDLGRVVDELSGPAGPLHGFRLERRRSLTKVRYRLTGSADLRGGSGAVGFGNVGDLDDRLRAAGVDPQRMEELLSARAAEGFRLRVVAELPAAKPAVWDVPVDRRVEIRASSTAPDRIRPALLALAAVLAGCALATAARGRRRSRGLPGLR